MKKALQIIGILMLTASFLSGMFCLVVNAFNPFSEQQIAQTIAILAVFVTIAIVAILTSEAMDNNYVEEEETEETGV